MGDTVAVDDVLCEVETDKATMEVPSPVAGTLLAAFFQEGDDVPVMVNIAAVGQPGEDVAGLTPAGATVGTQAGAQTPASTPAAVGHADSVTATAPSAPAAAQPSARGVQATQQRGSEPVGVSPRATWPSARGSTAESLPGSGPGGGA